MNSLFGTFCGFSFQQNTQNEMFKKNYFKEVWSNKEMGVFLVETYVKLGRVFFLFFFTFLFYHENTSSGVEIKECKSESPQKCMVAVNF